MTSNVQEWKGQGGNIFSPPLMCCPTEHGASKKAFFDAPLQ